MIKKAIFVLCIFCLLSGCAVVTTDQYGRTTATGVFVEPAPYPYYGYGYYPPRIWVPPVAPAPWWGGYYHHHRHH